LAPEGIELSLSLSPSPAHHQLCLSPLLADKYANHALAIFVSNLSPGSRRALCKYTSLLALTLPALVGCRNTRTPRHLLKPNSTAIDSDISITRFAPAASKTHLPGNKSCQFAAEFCSGGEASYQSPLRKAKIMSWGSSAETCWKTYHSVQT